MAFRFRRAPELPMLVRSGDPCPGRGGPHEPLSQEGR